MHGQKNENRKCQNVTNVIVMADFSKKYQGYYYCILLVVFLAIHSMIANSIFFREHIFFRPYQRVLLTDIESAKKFHFFFRQSICSMSIVLLAKLLKSCSFMLTHVFICI